VEDGDASVWGFSSFLAGQLSQRIHQVSNINIVWTSGGAGLAGGADPDGGAVQCLLHHAQVKEADEMVGHDIHGEGYRTAIGAFLALETGGDRLATQFLNLPA